MLSESKIPDSLKAQLLKQENQHGEDKGSLTTHSNQKGDTSDNQEIQEITDEMEDIEDKSVDTMDDYNKLTKEDKEQYGL